MITTRMGSEVEIAAYCGKHTPEGFAVPCRLVQCRFADGATRYRMAVSLRADGGMAEIDAAIDAAPEVVLSGRDLAAALAEAE